MGQMLRCYGHDIPESETLRHLNGEFQRKPVGFVKIERLAAADHLLLDVHRERIDQLVELGYTGRINGRQGSTFRYLLLDDGSADPEFLFDTDGKPEKGLNEKSTS